jgi:hypothetical protein
VAILSNTKNVIRRVVESHDIVSPAKLDSCRKEIGLTPFPCWAIRVSKEHKGAPIQWPTGVLFHPINVQTIPKRSSVRTGRE